MALLPFPSPKHLMHPKTAHENLLCGLCFEEQRSSGTKTSKHLTVCKILFFSSLTCVVFKLCTGSIHCSKPHPVQWSQQSLCVTSLWGHFYVPRWQDINSSVPQTWFWLGCGLWRQPPKQLAAFFGSQTTEAYGTELLTG